MTMNVTARRVRAGLVVLLVWARPTGAQQIAPSSSEARFALPDLLPRRQPDRAR